MGCLAPAFCPLGMGPPRQRIPYPSNHSTSTMFLSTPTHSAAYAVFYLAYVSAMICIRLWRSHPTFTTFYVVHTSDRGIQYLHLSLVVWIFFVRASGPSVGQNRGFSGLGMFAMRVGVQPVSPPHWKHS